MNQRKNYWKRLNHNYFGWYVSAKVEVGRILSYPLVEIILVFIIILVLCALWYTDKNLNKNWKNELSTWLTVAFGILGVFGSIASGKNLKEIQEASESLNDRIAKLSGMVGYQEVTHFGELFAKALWFVESLSSEEDILYVSYLQCFGSPHQCNKDVKKRYLECYQKYGVSNYIEKYDDSSKYRKSVALFSNTLQEKVQDCHSFTSLTLTPEQLRIQLLDELKKDEGYEELEINECIEKEIEIYNKFDGLFRSKTKPKIQMWQKQEITLFLLLAQQKKPELSNKPELSSAKLTGRCLFCIAGGFHVGEPDKIKGYYTENSDLVEIFKGIAESFLKNGNGKIADSDQPLINDIKTVITALEAQRIKE